MAQSNKSFQNGVGKRFFKVARRDSSSGR
jgi:hypothetical protein